ncbi:hypothetical protein TREES_T100019586 [Tupaia chinensis]|uniref:Nucleolin n=1 Tax=Tupaia chinensis TaxID=246437 RepID=L9JX93_TUPCH|nr:hypothetical protein TREES_T100019586 [Tupaia chinensis]
MSLQAKKGAATSSKKTVIPIKAITTYGKKGVTSGKSLVATLAKNVSEEDDEGEYDKDEDEGEDDDEEDDEEYEEEEPVKEAPVK